jgi:hypothetical protein
MATYYTNTRNELMALCKERGISGYSTQNKDGLIALLEGRISHTHVKRRRLRIISDENEDELITSIAKLDIAPPMPPKKSVKPTTCASGGAGIGTSTSTSTSTGGLTKWINTTETVRMYENKIEILPVVDVETVRLVLFEHGDKTYYRDPNKNKLFIRKSPKIIGPYIGRWNPQNECIVSDVADSDAE